MKPFIRNANPHFIQIASSTKRSFPFFPGMFFIVLGILVVLMPKLLIAALSAFLLFVGGLLCYGAWKLSQFKKKIEGLAKHLDGKVIVKSFDMREPMPRDIEVDDKKIIFH